VAYREQVDAVLQVMREVGAELADDANFRHRILEPLDIAGVESLGDSAVVLRCRFKVPGLEQWSVRREYLRRVKAAFDRKGIEIPFPHLTLYAGADQGGQAPPFRLQSVE
jgi:small conductance mechanosensitive channel